MSLREKFRDGLLDAKGKPRLAYARSYFFDYGLELDFNELQQFYCDWRDVEYVVLQRQMESLRIQGDVNKETIAVKCAKRGNDVYWWRVRKRLKSLLNLKEGTLFNLHSSMKSSNVLFVTLTYDTKRSTIREAWETVGKDFNKYIRNLRKKYGRISYLRCWEASKRGYAHVHILMIFRDYTFRVTRMNGKYRILEKESFKKSWHSFVDIQAVKKIEEGIKYITKYLTTPKKSAQSQVLTLALCWLFRKRSFALNGDFHDLLYTMIEMKHRLIQTDLFGHEGELTIV